MTAIPLVPAHRRLDLARLILRDLGFPAPPPRFVARAEELRDVLSRRHIDMYYTQMTLEHWRCGDTDLLLYDFAPEGYRCTTRGVTVYLEPSPTDRARLVAAGHGLLAEAFAEFTGQPWYGLHHTRTPALAAGLVTEALAGAPRSLEAEGPALAEAMARLSACPDEVVLGDPASQAPEHNLARVVAIARWLAEALGLPVAGEEVPPELAAYAATVCADLARIDAARGEELVRTVLACRGMRPAGESPERARARLGELDSAATHQLARTCWAAETPRGRKEELAADPDWLFRR